MNGRVVHVNDNVPGAVYIGRRMPRLGLKASPFANPYRVDDLGRDRALVRYEFDLRDRLAADHDGSLRHQLHALAGKPLACWCRHDGEERTEANGCHGDVLLAIIDRMAP